MNRLKKDYEKYDAQEREAEAMLSEALARLQRVRRLKSEVKERGDEVFQLGMETLDAWDDVAGQDSAAVLDVQSSLTTDLVDFNAIFSESFPEFPGCGGNAGVPSGSPGGPR